MVKQFCPVIAQSESHGKCFLEPNKHQGAHPLRCHGNGGMQESWEGCLPGAAAPWQENCPLDVQIGLITGSGNYLVSSDPFFKEPMLPCAELTLWALASAACWATEHSCV